MPTSFGPYQLLRRIASGGMGEVYLAVLERGGRFSKTVALKTILPQLAERPDFAERFEAEAATAALLNHPNIVQVFDHGRIDGRSYLTMELVEGPDLAELIAACAPEAFPPPVAVELGVQLCRALGHAHARVDLEGRPVGIIHGDVSPSNVLLSKDGAAKLADFGLARLVAATSGERAVAGKIAYMSPEQAAGDPLSPASDLYSLGLVLFELLTGRRAYPSDQEPAELLATIRAGACASLGRTAEHGLPAGLGRVVDGALSADPVARPAGAAVLAAELARACPPAGPEALAAFLADRLPAPKSGPGLRPEPTEVADQPVSPVDTADPGAAGFAPARHWKPALVALVVLTWGVGLGWWAFHSPPPPRPSPPAPGRPATPAGLSAALSADAPRPEPGPPAGPADHEPNSTRPVPAPGAAADWPHPPPRVAADRPPRPPAGAGPAEAVVGPRPPELGVSLPEAFSVEIDHRQVLERKLGLSVGRAHLIQLAASSAAEPDIMLRLQPPKDGRGSWRLSVRSRPWMRIRLAGRPAGQTPRAGLGLPAGRVELELNREARRVRFVFEVPGREATP